MAAPRPDRKGADRRAGRDRRGGRPRSVSEPSLDWAIQQLFLGRDRPEVARDLGVDRRTLDRRLAARRQDDRIVTGRALANHLYRCPKCWATVATPICPVCQTVINVFHAQDVGMLENPADYFEPEVAEAVDLRKRYRRGKKSPDAD